MDCRALIVERIRQSGPLTVADYMDLALYAPGLGYYARAAQRSGRAGDFVTSVDSGPLFGLLLADHLAHLLRAIPDQSPTDDALDLVEVAAGNGRLSRDVLDALEQRHPDLYARVALTLVERSAEARAAQDVTLAVHAAKLRVSRPELPSRLRGVLFCNELLDAMPVHLVEMTPHGLAEVFVDLAGDRLVTRQGPPSTPALAEYFALTGVALPPGARAEVHLAGLDWLRRAADALVEGALVIIDYGYEAARLYGSPHATGTLRTFHRHLADASAPDDPAVLPWLVEPGTRDLTTHVDLTAVKREAERCGLTVSLDTDQTRFLLTAAERSGLLGELEAPERLADRLVLKTLLVPGGMGTTHRVLVFERHGRVVNEPPTA
jgi:SAM-dependent MidA family methyltransferase